MCNSFCLSAYNPVQIADFPSAPNNPPAPAIQEGCFYFAVFISAIFSRAMSSVTTRCVTRPVRSAPSTALLPAVRPMATIWAAAPEIFSGTRTAKSPAPLINSPRTLK